MSTLLNNALFLVSLLVVVHSEEVCRKGQEGTIFTRAATEEDGPGLQVRVRLRGVPNQNTFEFRILILLLGRLSITVWRILSAKGTPHNPLRTIVLPKN